MRRALRIITACLTLALAVPALGLTPHSPVLIQDDAANPQTVNAGEEFFIALPSRAGSGSYWTATVADPNLIAYEGNISERPSSAGPGTGAQQLFIFHANRSGTASITFNYTQAFDQNNTSAKTLTYYITVQ